MDRRRFLETTALSGASSFLTTSRAEDFAQSHRKLQIRIARPTDRLPEVTSFYRDGLGLPVIGHFENHAGYTGIMFGMPEERLHLEFTHNDTGSPCPAPTKDNLLVFYMPNAQDHLDAVQRLEQIGHTAVEPENPYWKAYSKTFEDPDGWRVVLYHGEAFAR
jgi:catechol 2,3-dioxygenase-like lactoylglutathione lyase family enzyme